MREISIIIPTLNSNKLVLNCINGFSRFRPEDVKLTYVVIENYGEMKDHQFLAKCNDTVWINNKTQLTGSEANAEAIEIGLKHVKTDLVMIVHNDTCITSHEFIPEILKKYEEGNKLIGTLYDMHPNRIKAIHVSGLFTETELARKVDYMPVYENGIQIMDVGDKLTKYCRDNGIKHCYFENTYNSPELVNTLEDKYKTFNVARCIVNNKVAFMHLARGTAKMQGNYHKEGKIMIDEWLKFCGEELYGIQAYISNNASLQ